MNAHSMFVELLHKPGEPAGSSGFRLVGRSSDGGSVARLWLRRADTWNRYLDPRSPQGDWDLRLYVRRDSAFALQQEFSLADLDGLKESYEWPTDASELAALSPNGDSVHDAALEFALSVTAMALAEPPPETEVEAVPAEDQ
jgi:hypothetical protein